MGLLDRRLDGPEFEGFSLGSVIVGMAMIAWPDFALEARSANLFKIGGGVSTVRQYLQAGLIDELHFSLHLSCSDGARRCSRP
jgi:hypothetical protein